MSVRVPDEQLAADLDYYERPNDRMLDSERNRLVSALRELQEARVAIALSRAHLDEALWDEVAWSGEDLVECMERVYEALGGCLDGPASDNAVLGGAS